MNYIEYDIFKYSDYEISNEGFTYFINSAINKLKELVIKLLISIKILKNKMVQYKGSYIIPKKYLEDKGKIKDYFSGCLFMVNSSSMEKILSRVTDEEELANKTKEFEDDYKKCKNMDEYKRITENLYTKEDWKDTRDGISFDPKNINTYEKDLMNLKIELIRGNISPERLGIYKIVVNLYTDLIKLENSFFKIGKKDSTVGLIENAKYVKMTHAIDKNLDKKFGKIKTDYFYNDARDAILGKDNKN